MNGQKIYGEKYQVNIFVKAREWLKRGKSGKDPVDSFSNLWRGFNNLYFTMENGQERDKIKHFLNQNISVSEAEKILWDYSSQVAYLLSQPVIDMRGNGRDTSSNIQTFNTTTVPLIRLEEVFMVIYQIRCNLEHGQKSPNRKRDVELCLSAIPLLEYVLEKNS